MRPPLLIHLFPFDSASAGVRVMHYLPALLRAADFPVAVSSVCHYNPSIPVRARALADDIAVYPDATRDNPLEARRICRYMLYYASAYFGGQRIKQDECAIVFLRDYLADVQAHCDHPVTEEDIVTLPTLDDSWCFAETKDVENVVYVGKGNANQMPPIPGPCALIPKNPSREPRGDHVDAHQRTLALLRRARSFYTLDEHTVMSIEAALCGCKVFILKNGKFEEQTDLLARANTEIMDPAASIPAARHFGERVHKFFDERGKQSAPAITTAAKIKVGVFTLDEPRSACAQLRLGAPLNYLQSQGKVEFLALNEGPVNAIKFNKENIAKSDVIVVQRGMPAVLPYQALRDVFKVRPVKIVFELDDALTMLPPGNPHRGYYESLRPQLEAYLRHADLVTVSTPRLKEIYSIYNSNVAVLPNCVDASLWQPSPPKTSPPGKTRILFSGTLTHGSDLALIERAIGRIIEEFGDAVEFLFWGNLPATLSDKPQVKQAAQFTQDYPRYAEGLKALAVDFALVPLEVNPFNQGKSDIKWLEYSACNIPGIFTDIEAYNKTVEHGKTGWLVPNTTEAWHEAIKKLITDPSLRRQMARNAHQTVMTQRSVAATAGLWLQAYESLLTAPPKQSIPEKLEVSIVIPTFNNLPLTRQCLEALQKHTAPGSYEIIIVDNASTDGTVDFLRAEEQAGRARVILNPENAGFARACNQGAEAAKADLILFLNNDTQVTAGWLDAMIAASRRPEVGIVGAKLLYANGTIQHAGIEFVGKLPDHPHRHAAADAPEVNRFRALDMVTGACLLIRRDLFLKLAGFDEAFRNGIEDIDLCLRARAAGCKVVYEPKAAVFHLECQTPGRFKHALENLNIFSRRWQKSFDNKKRFIAPKSPCVMVASKSALRQSESPKVAWEGTFVDFGSLSHVNRQFTKCLAPLPGLHVCAVARDAGVSPPRDARVTVRHQWPPDWSRPKAGALVVIQPWEFGALPREWVEASAHVDEFWLPSNYVRQVYIDSGVDPGKIVVVPNGVEAERYRKDAAPLALPTKKKFRFLFVGGTIHRKGPDLLLASYLKTFTDADDVCLVIKDFGGKSWYAGQTFENQIKAAQAQKGAPEILYLTEELTADAMPGLYAACHCLVHPYRGEGFGLPVLEAMACGLSVIVTAGGSTDDFCREEFVYRVPAQRRNLGSEIGGKTLARDGWWLEPDANALADRMKWVAVHPQEARIKGRAASDYVRRDWSWHRGALIAHERLCDLASRKPVAPKPARTRPTAPTPIVPPETAKIGDLAEACQWLDKKNFQSAKESVCAALKARPFHPEAYLLLGKTAQVSGDADTARHIGQFLTRLVPHWKPAKQFLKGIPPKSPRPGSFDLPPGLLASAEKPRLSVCLIVKNEEKFLERCLQSVRDVAWQIVVVDTGSTDGTIEIARRFNAEVHSFTWIADFSAARNEALKHATGDWVLSLDADEELMPEHRQTLQAEMQSSKVIGYRLPIFNVGQLKYGCGYVPRLFRNAPGLFFVGRVHEEIFSSLETRAGQWGLEAGLGRAALMHYGYEETVVADRGKIERNLRLLQKAVEEMPDSPNLVMNLGLELVRSGKLEEGLEEYREALRLTSLMPPGKATPEFCESLLTQLTSNLLEAGHYEEIVELWEQPFPKSRERTASHHLVLGMAHMKLKRPAPALENFRQCLAKRGQPVFSPVNKQVLGALPRHCLALAQAALSQHAEAEQSFRDALKEDATARPLRFDFAKYQFGRGRTLDALQLANALAAEDPQDTAVWQFGGEAALSQPEFIEFALNWTKEALKHAPGERALFWQRAEALMLSQQLELALPLWIQDGSSPCAGPMAALIVCEVVTDKCERRFEPVFEKAVSQEFLKWYRRLIKFKANHVVGQINAKLEEVRAILPTAVGVLDTALKRAATAPAA